MAIPGDKKKGLIGTLIFHVALLVLLLFIGFYTPLPLPEEEGILVNFGDADTGLGLEEPAPVAKQEEPPVEQEEKVEETVPPPPEGNTRPEACQRRNCYPGF